jgi:hypothetical protein
MLSERTKYSKKFSFKLRIEGKSWNLLKTSFKIVEEYEKKLYLKMHSMLFMKLCTISEM